MLGGSLTAVPGLRIIGSDTPLSTCALVSPLFEASIPVTVPWRDQLLDDPLIEPLDHAASHRRTPLLVVNGALDEVAPLQQVTRIEELARGGAPLEMEVMAEEGHIFKRAESWRRAQKAISDFFAKHLQPASQP
jgi:acetyl esterase/lipase